MAAAIMMIPIAAHHGTMASRISPRTIPAIPTLVLGVMMTPSIRTHRGLLSPWLQLIRLPWRTAVPISLPVDDEANELLTRNPLALLIAMLLDQQVPLERAFSAPRDLVRRLGHEPSAGELATFDPVALAAAFSERPALHRFPKAMAARTQDLARIIVDEYDGDAASLWTTASSGGELFKRISALPGF